MISSPTETRNALGYALARPLFVAEIAIGATDPRAAHNRPLPQESAVMVHMAPVRQRAYAAGRVAAHSAMAALGQSARPVLTAPDRAPVWPDGLAGSISHSKTCCVAALGPSSQFRALGVDVEEATALDSDLLPVVCTSAELGWLAAQPKSEAEILAKMIFSAKECAYKCQYALTRALFGFETFEVTPDLDTGQFEATFRRDVLPFSAGTCLHGRFVIANGLIVTAMALRV